MFHFFIILPWRSLAGCSAFYVLARARWIVSTETGQKLGTLNCQQDC